MSPRAIVLLGAAGVFATILTAVFGWSLLSSLSLALFVAYIPSYLDGAQYAVTPREGSRYWHAFASLPLWKRLFRYFPATVTTPPNFDYAAAAREGAQFVLAMHPHGMLSIDHFLVFTDACDFLTQVMPMPRRDLAASVVFRIPLLREFVLWLGCVDASAPTVHKTLSQGLSLQLYPGGIAEQLETDSEKPKVVARGRKGFIKLALAYDVPIVPVYVFGEDKLYTSVSFLLGLRRWLVKALRIGIVFFFGRLDTLGLLPEREPLEAVMGTPLWPKGVTRETQKAVWQERLKSERSETGGSKSAPATPGSFNKGRRVRREVSSEEVDEMHDRYLAAMEQLFEQHKHKHPKYAKAKLEILSSRG